MSLATRHQQPPAQDRHADAAPDRVPGTGVITRLLRRPEVPWAAVVALALWLLHAAGNPVADAALYGGYWVAGIVVPGTLLQRALAGSRSLPEDLGFGAVVGLAWQLIGWFLFTSLQIQAALWAWPALLVAAFIVVPSWRRHWASAERLPLTWSWTAAGSMSVALLMLHLNWLRITDLPPYTRLVEPDLWYHLSINHELTRTVFPELPYVAGEPLEYHWFANVHMASGQLMTGVEPAAIVLHLWLVPMVAVFFLVTCALSRLLTGLWWPALLTATCTVSLPLAVAVSSDRVGAGLTPVVYPSCSSVLAGVVVVALAGSILRLLRGRTGAGSWVVLALLTLLAAGTKPTVLPVAVAGAVVVLAYSLARRRPRSHVVAVLGVLVTGMAAGSVTVMGGTAGSELRLFGYFRLVEGFREVTGDDSVQGVTGGWVVPGIIETGARGWMLAGVLLAALLLYHLPSLLGVAGVALRGTRDDVAVWWLSGANVAAYGPLLLIDHMGGSQKYFVVTVFPLGMALTAHVLASHLPAQRGRAFRWSVLAVVLLGTLGASLSEAAFGHDTWRTLGSTVIGLGLPALTFVAMALVLAVVCRGVLRASGGTRHTVVLMAALTLGWSVPYLLAMTMGQFLASASSPGADELGPRLPASKQQGALWLASRGSADDVVATNVHCFRVSSSGICDARSFWLSALSGRRVLLEGWGYTPENARTRVRPQLSYELQPSPWPRRLEMSDAAVSAPTPALLEQLADRYDVTWIFADKTVAPVAPALHDLATLRYDNRDVAIFELTEGS